MTFNWAVDLGDIILATVSLGVIPLLRAFFTVVVELRDSVQLLQHAVGDLDPASGILGDVKELKAEARKQRNHIIELFAKTNTTWRDRT